MSILSELKKFGKKIVKEVFRPGPLLKAFDSFIPDVPEPDPLPIPDPPIVGGQPGEGATAQKRKLIVSGRRGTILTGQLTPKKIGKKGLLG